MRGYYINRAWLVSAGAQKVYLVCACLGTVFLLLFAYSVFAEAYGMEVFFEHTPILRLLAKLLFLSSLLGAVTLQVGMLYFWWNFDREGTVSKTLGGLVLLVTPPGGTILYYAIFYRRAMGALDRDASAAKA